MDDEMVHDSSHQPPYQVGYVAPSKAERNKNDSKFYITYDTMYGLNGWNVIFAEVFDGIDMLDEVEAAGSTDGTPRNSEVTISRCEVKYSKLAGNISYWMNNQGIRSWYDHKDYLVDFLKHPNLTDAQNDILK